MSRTRMTNLPFFLSALSPVVIFDSDNPLISCPLCKKGKRKVQGVTQSQTAALPRPQEEEETDKSKQAQTEKKYEMH